ncbi:MAG: preprotein translocase subunit SecE [Patescibacteria group bacterium]
MLSFIRESKEELAKVTWPTKAETIRLTRYVIGVSLIVGVLVTLLDALFNYGLEKLILR